MIKAIVFDCFGVLTTEGWFALLKKYFVYAPDKLRQAQDLLKQFDRGSITHTMFIQQLSDLAKIKPEQVSKYVYNNVANEELFDYIAQKLKPRYKIGMLSNAGGDWLNELFTPRQAALFDAVVLSYQTSYMKPEPEIYQLICEKLGVKSHETVFVDDVERHVSGGAAIGMHAVWYKNFSQMQKELEALL